MGKVIRWFSRIFGSSKSGRHSMAIDIINNESLLSNDSNESGLSINLNTILGQFVLNHEGTYYEAVCSSSPFTEPRDAKEQMEFEKFMEKIKQSLDKILKKEMFTEEEGKALNEAMTKLLRECASGFTFKNASTDKEETIELNAENDNQAGIKLLNKLLALDYTADEIVNLCRFHHQDMYKILKPIRDIFSQDMSCGIGGSVNSQELEERFAHSDSDPLGSCAEQKQEHSIVKFDDQIYAMTIIEPIVIKTPTGQTLSNESDVAIGICELTKEGYVSKKLLLNNKNYLPFYQGYQSLENIKSNDHLSDQLKNLFEEILLGQSAALMSNLVTDPTIVINSDNSIFKQLEEDAEKFVSVGADKKEEPMIHSPRLSNDLNNSAEDEQDTINRLNLLINLSELPANRPLRNALVRYSALFDKDNISQLLRVLKLRKKLITYSTKANDQHNTIKPHPAMVNLFKSIMDTQDECLAEQIANSNRVLDVSLNQKILKQLAKDFVRLYPSASFNINDATDYDSQSGESRRNSLEFSASLSEDEHSNNVNTEDDNLSEPSSIRGQAASEASVKSLAALGTGIEQDKTDLEQEKRINFLNKLMELGKNNAIYFVIVKEKDPYQYMDQLISYFDARTNLLKTANQLKASLLGLPSEAAIMTVTMADAGVAEKITECSAITPMFNVTAAAMVNPSPENISNYFNELKTFTNQRPRLLQPETKMTLKGQCDTAIDKYQQQNKHAVTLRDRGELISAFGFIGNLIILSAGIAAAIAIPIVGYAILAAALTTLVFTTAATVYVAKRADNNHMLAQANFREEQRCRHFLKDAKLDDAQPQKEPPRII